MAQVRGGASSASAYSRNPYEDTHIFDKTRLCKFYAKGQCKRGQACTFAHGEGEVQPQPDFFRTQLCADFVRSGACKAGSGCSYAHSPQELRQAKTHTSSRGQGSRKTADRQVSLEEVRRLEVMQQEVARLRSQLLTLQTITRNPLPPCTSGSNNAPLPLTETQIGPSVKLVDEQDMEEGRDSLGMPAGFSRQSTEEGTEPPQCFSRRSTMEDGDAWGDLASASCSDDEEGRLPCEAEEGEEEIACELLVKRTFISLEPVEAGSCRRTRSAPASRRHGIV